MHDLLAAITEHKLQEIAQGKKALPLAELEQQAKQAQPPRDFIGALRAKPIAIIAELKKASPSKGLIRQDFDPEQLAKACERGGAACLSVLTDQRFFQGADGYLQQARAASSLPVLRKDFFYDVWQIAEARALGADCILLIMAVISDAQAAELTAAAKQWGMAVLPEAHDEEEIARALRLGTELIGINNRDLRSFETNLAATERLAKHVPPDHITICESGIASRADIERMRQCSINHFLIGEMLMRQKNVQKALESLL